MVKFKQVYQDVVTTHKAEFEEFKKIHDLYKTNQKRHYGMFNKMGKPVRNHLDKAVNVLCGKTENSGHGAFSSKLADKFWGEVKKDYPMIDFVGVVFS